MIRDKSRTYGVIRDIGKVHRLVSPEDVARALGAEEFHREPTPGGAPHVFYTVREDIMRRLTSKGGRPGLEGTTKRKKIPFTPSDWEALEGTAEHLTRTGTRVSPGQLASAIIHERLERFGSPTQPRLIGRVPGLEQHLARTQKHIIEHEEFLDVKGVIEWARNFPGLQRIWIVVPNFLDDKDPEVLNEVIYNIEERNVTFTYFVRFEDMRKGERFSRLQKQISDLVGEDKARKHVIGVPLIEEQLMWLRTDHVIANPHRITEAVGFQYFRRAKIPAFAIRMEDVELVEMIQELTPWANREVKPVIKLLADVK